MRFRTHKYNARKTEYNGVVYDSKLEAKLAADIDLLWKTNALAYLERQKLFRLIGFNGSSICNHIVDFHIVFNDGHEEVWEAKGVATPDWIIKRKLFIDNYPNIKYVVHSTNKKLKKLSS